MASPRVRSAMRQVPRSHYLPRAQRRSADLDQPVPIGHGATCSQPTTVAIMLELLDPQPGDRVLDVGSGSGWTVAILAALVAPHGTVTGVEVTAVHVRDANRRLEDAGLDPVTAHVHPAEPGVLGWPSGAPYDRVLVSAAAAQRVPDELSEQLADGGRMVLPVDNRLSVVQREQRGFSTWDAPGHFRFVPLR